MHGLRKNTQPIFTKVSETKCRKKLLDLGGNQDRVTLGFGLGLQLGGGRARVSHIPQHRLCSIPGVCSTVTVLRYQLSRDGSMRSTERQCIVVSLSSRLSNSRVQYVTRRDRVRPTAASTPTWRHSEVKVVVEGGIAAGLGVRLVASPLGRQQDQMHLGQLAAAAFHGRQLRRLANRHRQPLPAGVVAELEPYRPAPRRRRRRGHLTGSGHVYGIRVVILHHTSRR